MPNYINKIKLPAGTIYELQDTSALHYIGKTSTVLTDGATTNPITINSVNVTAVANDYVLANGNSNNNFYFNGTSWVLMDPAASSSGVTSLDVGNTSHLTVDPVAGTGAVTIDVDSNYSIPSTSDQTGWSQKSAGIKASNGTSTEVIADSTYYTTLVAGSNVSILGADTGADQGKITISATDTTYENKTAASGGTDVSLVTTGDKYTWDNKQSSIKVGSSAVADANHVTTFAEGANVDITAENGTITIAATDTTYSTFDATHAGLVPAGGTTAGFLKNDGSWATPQDTTYTEGTGINISNANVISNTGVTAVTESNSSTGTNGTISVTTNGTTEEVAVKGLNTAAYKDVDTVIDTANPSTKLPTSAAVNTAITNAVNALPEPMVFKGTVNGTYPATPSVGDTYKATANSTSGVIPAYKMGDTVIYSEPSTGVFEWVVIPSGDEPSGTVTGITGSDGVITTNDTTGSSTISTSGTVKLSLVSTHTTTVNAGAATSTANRSYPLAIDGNNKLAVNVPWENTTYANGSGITIGSGNAINHSNSVTASGDTAAALKVKYDAQGHITGSATLAASDIGLGNVGNFLAVSTAANQGLDTVQQQNARNNINIASNATTVKSATTNNTVVNGFSTSSVSGKNLYTYDSANERLTFNFLSYSTGSAIGTTDVSVYAVKA